MSFDRFASGLQLPNVGSGVSPRASDSSDFLRLYFKTDQLYHTDEAGTEVQLTGLGLSFDDLTDKTGGTGTYATTGYLTAGLGSGGVSLTTNDGGGNASVTFNHAAQTPEQTGNAGRIRVNTDSTTGGFMEFQVGSGLTGGVAYGLTTWFTIEENLLTSNAALNMPDTRVLQFGTGVDWELHFDGTDACMDLNTGIWRWRDGANSNALRIQWTPDAGLEFQDGHQLQLGTSNDLRMYHASNVNYFDLVNGDLKIRDVSGTATDRFVFTQAGNLGIGTTTPDVDLHVAGGLRVETSSDFDSGTDTNKTASIMLPATGEIAFDTGDFIRTLISKDSSGYINVGQNGTGIISQVNLLPGTSGAVYVQSDNNNALVINNNGSGNARMQYQIAGSNKFNVGIEAANSNYTIYDTVNATTPFRIEPGSGNNAALVIDGSGDITAAGTITSDEIQARVTSSGTTTGTLTASDANTKVTMTGDITVPNSTFATDDTIMFDGNGTDRTLTPASGLTIYVDGAAASSIDVGANKIIGLTFRSGTVAIATGVDATTSTTYLYSATSTDTSTNHNSSFTPTVVDFDTELINQGSFTESGGRITVPIAGVYRVYGMVTYGRNSTEQRLSLQVQVFKNATATGARGRGAYVRGQNNHDHASAYIEDFVDCAANDILDIRAFQDAVTGTSIVQANQSRLLIQRIG